MSHDPDKVAVHGWYSAPDPVLDLLEGVARTLDPSDHASTS